jgi:hypothetical protein
MLILIPRGSVYGKVHRKHFRHSCVISRERILCSIKCQNMRINMQSNPLKYALESLKYALLIQNMQVYRIT